MASLRFVVLAFAGFTWACGSPSGGDDPSSGGSGAAGGAGTGSGGTAGAGGIGGGPRDIEVEPVMYTTSDLPLELLADEDPVELWRAPQGGHVLLVGARVRGLGSDTIELRARVRDRDTRFILSEEARTVVMQPVAGEPDLQVTDRRSNSQAAHVAVCPNYGEKDVVGRLHDLEVEVVELYDDFSSGNATVAVMPTCFQEREADRAKCLCECERDYVLGKCATPAGAAR